MAKRKSVTKTPAKSRAKKPAPIVAAELDKAIAEDFDERQQLADPGRLVLKRELIDKGPQLPKLSANDIDAAWEDSDGAETVGGHILTPDQDRVDDLGAAAGLTYADDEPLNFDKVAERDEKRWELNPASAETADAEEEEWVDDDDEDEDDEEEDDLDDVLDEDEVEELDVLDADEEDLGVAVVKADPEALEEEEEEEEDLDVADDEDDEDDWDLLDDDEDDDDDDDD